MYIILLTYKQPLETVEKYLSAHRAFLDRHYASGDLICSGPQRPRTGGVILCRARDEAGVQEMIRRDPFYVNGIADYRTIRFDPVKRAEGFERLIG